MYWSYLEKYSDPSFKRATGIHKKIFLEIIEVIRDYKQKNRKHPRSGNKASLSMEDTLLLVLMYYREYRTQYHIGITYGISESRVCELIKEIESIIIQDSRYHLPGKKQLLKSENSFEVVLVDVSESPIERPKKNNENTTQAKRKGIPIKHSLWQK